MDKHVWRVYLGGAAVAVAAFPFLPAGGWARPAWQVVLGLAAAVAIVVGLHRCRTWARAAWWLFAAGIAGTALGGAVEAYASAAPAGGAQLALYPAVAIGLALLIRRRTPAPDWTTRLDAAAVTTGLALLAWAFLIQPALAEPDAAGQAARAVGTVALVAMAVRLLLGAGVRPPAFWLLGGALLAFVTGDAVGPVAATAGTMAHLAAYALLAAAALHPSARGVGESLPRAAPRPAQGSMVALSVAASIPPLLLGFQAIRRDVTDGLAIAAAGAIVFLIVVVRMAQLLRALQRQTLRVRELSRTDELTGLPSHRAWSGELPRAIERARRDRAPLSVAVLDLDHFTRFNDAYGRLAGDRLLKAAAAIWRSQIRAVDLLGRGDGDEFVLVLPSADDVLGEDVVERLREVTPLGERASVGLASWDGQETSDELVARARAALSAAKQTGRDRVTVAVAGIDPLNHPEIAVAHLA